MPMLDGEDGERKTEVSEADVRKALERPSDFGYGGDKPMFKTWSLGPVIRTRDSNCLDESNAAMLEKHLESDPTLADDWCITGASHWAVGWVDHLSFRAVEDDGKTPTRIFRVLKAWFDALEDYPVADEADFSEREAEAANQVWRDCYDTAERIEYIRDHKDQFEFRNFVDLLGCVRGKYFAGWASELLN